MGFPVHGGTSRYNAVPLPYTLFDRQRDKLIAQLFKGAVTDREYDEKMRRVDRAEKRWEERAKARRAQRA